MAYTKCAFQPSLGTFLRLTTCSLLSDVYAALKHCTSKKVSVRVDRWLNRAHLLDDMLRLERLLDDFRVNFSVRAVPLFQPPPD